MTDNLPVLHSYSFTEMERFEDKFIPEPNSGCWLWCGSLSMGYGVLYNPLTQNNKGAHRISWELYRGDIPSGLFVLHKCDNRQCVNPDHLFLGTHKENMEDCRRKGRQTRTQGEKHGNAKLTTADVLAIRAQAGSLSQHKIAAKFGVSRSLIGLVLQRKLWAHIQ